MYPKTLLKAAAALGIGALFGVGAMTLLQRELVGGPILEFISGTWGWAVVAVIVTWALSRGEHGKPVRRWLRAWLYATLFLVATTIGWYGTAGTITASETPFVVAICAPIAAGIALVGAFISDRGPLGLIAGLSLPAGLALALLADPPRAWHDDATVALWWTRQGLGIAMALAVVAFWYLRRSGRLASAAGPGDPVATVEPTA